MNRNVKSLGYIAQSIGEVFLILILLVIMLPIMSVFLMWKGWNEFLDDKVGKK